MLPWGYPSMRSNTHVRTSTMLHCDAYIQSFATTSSTSFCQLRQLSCPGADRQSLANTPFECKRVNEKWNKWGGQAADIGSVSIYARKIVQESSPNTDTPASMIQTLESPRPTGNSQSTPEILHSFVKYYKLPLGLMKITLVTIWNLNNRYHNCYPAAPLKR